MKKINENFFKQDQNSKIAETSDLLLPKEEVLWKGRPKRFAYIMSKSIAIMPFAILWLLIDATIIISVFTSNDSGAGFLTIFFIGFFALHLMPVWIWLGSIIKATNEMNSIEYVITNKRIFEVFGKNNKYIRNQMNLTDLKECNLKISFLDLLSIVLIKVVNIISLIILLYSLFLF